MGFAVAPCKGCKKRHIACHAECEEYIAWKAKHDAARHDRQEYLNNYFKPPQVVDRITKLKKKKNRKHYRDYLD